MKNVKAVELQNPDGKSEGTELTFGLEVTNKNKVAYKIPANTKPKAYNLFHDETRVGISVTLE